jgi:hypothetical protein
VLPQPLVRVRLTVLATAPVAAAEVRRTDWKRMLFIGDQRKESEDTRLARIAEGVDIYTAEQSVFWDRSTRP